jgi:RNA polymerase sigma factor (sigma-70 family)
LNEIRMPERHLSGERGRIAAPPGARLLLRCQSDQRLVDQVQAGNDLAFEVIVDRYRPALLRYCRRLLSASRAEDAVQQTFLNAYESIEGDAESRRLRPWLYRIAHNVAVDVLRKDGRIHERLGEDDMRSEASDQVAERQEELRGVIAGLQALPSRQRHAILLRELEGRSYNEIATALGVTEGAVRQLLNRARNALRASASAMTPPGLLLALEQADSGGAVLSRMAELCTTPAGAAIATACATVTITAAEPGIGLPTPFKDGHGDRAEASPHSERSSPASRGGPEWAFGARRDLDRSHEAGGDSHGRHRLRAGNGTGPRSRPLSDHHPADSGPDDGYTNRGSGNSYAGGDPSSDYSSGGDSGSGYGSSGSDESGDSNDDPGADYNNVPGAGSDESGPDGDYGESGSADVDDGHDETEGPEPDDA